MWPRTAVGSDTISGLYAGLHPLWLYRRRKGRIIADFPRPAALDAMSFLLRPANLYVVLTYLVLSAGALRFR
jgi:hypothetical protein